jgi:hypothetical protein
VLIIWYFLPKEFKDLIVRREVVYGIASTIVENADKNPNECLSSQKGMLLIYLKYKFNIRE